MTAYLHAICWAITTSGLAAARRDLGVLPGRGVQAMSLPADVTNYLLDVQPGYQGDPSSGVYNRVWMLGDTNTISLQAQGRLDEITRLIPVQSRPP